MLASIFAKKSNSVTDFEKKGQTTHTIDIVWLFAFFSKVCDECDGIYHKNINNDFGYLYKGVL